MREYKLISADGHINEPPDLWSERLPKRYQDRWPRMERFEEGDAWIIEGWQGPINFGGNISGAIPLMERSPWKFWEDVPPGGYDPASRLKEQDIDGVDAEVVYPTPRPSMAILGNPDSVFQLECVRTYNDWLSEYAGHAPDRLIGAAMMPTTGLQPTLAELERTMKMPGLRTPLLSQWPSGGVTIAPEDDAFWGALVEIDVPLSVHVRIAPSIGGGDHDPDRKGISARGELRHTETPANCIELIYSGAFDRFPDLRIVFAEVDSSWVPYVKEQLDNRYHRLHPSQRPDIKQQPSYYFDRHVSTTYLTDYYAIVNRHFIGVDRMMWSSDYPHIGADYPKSWEVIEKHCKDVPADEKHALLAGNCATMYGLIQ